MAMPSGSNSDVFAGAAARADARLAATVADFFLPDEARLDDRTRLALRTVLQRLVNGVEADLRRRSGRLLAGRGLDDAAAAMLAAEDMALPLLTDAGLLRDPELMEEMVAHTRAAMIADGLPVAVDETGAPSLLVRLADLPDTVIAGAARALLAADSGRDLSGAGLPGELQHRLVWWVAAAIRQGVRAGIEIDRAVGEAALRCLAAYDEGSRPAAVADRLVAAIDPLPAELPPLLIEALGDRRLTLFLSLLARAIATDAETARALIVDPADDRLWTALRAAGLSREEVARVALSLAEADPRRDIEVFADRLDEIAALPMEQARAAIAPLSLPRDLRAAMRALARGGR